MPMLDRDRKILWARAHNRCAICRCQLVVAATELDTEAVVGDEAHIVAQSPGGARSNDPLSVSMDCYDNRILLCKVDHKVVDDQRLTYTSDVLRRLKLDHERWAEGLFNPRPPSEATVNLPARNPDFIGRDALFDRLAADLGSGPVAVVAVHGLGGLGKTQVALEWAYRGVAAGRYEIAWWVRAETAVTLAEDLAALAPGLGVPVVADQTKVVAGVRAVLRSRSKWLVVLDNAPDAVGVKEWIPAGDGDVVITSRVRGWGGIARPVELTLFTRAESVAFLARRTDNSGPVVDELAAVLGDLPLALAQAAAYIEQHGGLSAAGYLDLFRDAQGAARLLATGLADYPHSVATTWLMHFRELERLAPTALVLLRLCAFLDPDEINVRLLLSRPDLLSGGLTGQLAAVSQSAVGVEEAVGALTGAGLVSRVDDSRIRLHRLVSVVTRHQLADTAMPPVVWAQQVIRLLSRLIPDEPWRPETWPVSANLAAHIVATAEHAPPVADTAVALGRYSQYLNSRAEFGSAVDVLRRASAIFEAVYGSEHPEVARALNSMGNVQQQLGDLEAAHACQQRALAIFEAVYGSEHPDVARALDSLGNVQRQLGDPVAAQATLGRALAIFEAVYGPEHPDVARALGNLGLVQRASGDPVAAHACQQRALAIFEAVYGSEHPDVARALGSLGLVQWTLGDLEAAHACQQRALAIFEAVYGSDHPDVGVNLVHLGIVQQWLGDLAAGQASLQRALTILRARLGDNHPHTRFLSQTLARGDVIIPFAIDPPAGEPGSAPGVKVEHPTAERP